MIGGVFLVLAVIAGMVTLGVRYLPRCPECSSFSITTMLCGGQSIWLCETCQNVFLVE